MKTMYKRYASLPEGFRIAKGVKTSNSESGIIVFVPSRSAYFQGNITTEKILELVGEGNQNSEIIESFISHFPESDPQEIQEDLEGALRQLWVMGVLEKGAGHGK